MSRRRRFARAGAGAALLLVSGSSAVASASNGLDSPEVGVVQMSRGGAWLARADNALAAYFNPAAMAFNPSSVHLGLHLMFPSRCYERRGEDGQPVAPGGQLTNPPPDEVCAGDDAGETGQAWADREGVSTIFPFPNPQIAASFRILKQLAVGIAVLGPHAQGVVSWPATISYANAAGFEQEHPAPQRYMIMEQNAIALFPTVSIAYRPIKQLSFGAGFTWGLAALEFSNMTEITSSPPGTPDDFRRDALAKISGFDGFIPGLVASVQWEPSRRFDVAAWYRLSDAIDTRVDLDIWAPFYTNQGLINDDAVKTEVKDAGYFRLAIPMEARIGVRYKHPRQGAQTQEWVSKYGAWGRDSWSEDVFDVEVDLTWAHNSAVEEIELIFDEAYPINTDSGTAGSIPTNASLPRQWKDVVGVRLGGEVVPIPDLLAVRAGGFFESKGVDDAYLNLDFHLSERVGLALGTGVRLGPVDINLGYQHTFFFDLDNGGKGEVRTITGDQTTGTDPPQRTRQTVNGGRASASLDEISLGGTFHF